MNITILGSGNIGTQFAVELKASGHKVTLLSMSKIYQSNNLTIFDKDNDKKISVSVDKITNNLEESVKEAEMILVTYPSFMFEQTTKKILNMVKNGVVIGFLPGLGGVEFYCQDLINKKGATIFGVQRVPAVARLIDDNTVCVSGKREKMYLASIPKIKAKELCDLFSGVLKMEFIELPNYLCVTLTPSNPILHTTRLKCLFEDYYPGVYYKNVPKFYGDWDNKSSELLLRCDLELQNLLKAIPNLDLSHVKSLKEHYESENAESLTKKIRSINSLKEIKTPMIKLDGGYVPDFKSRYFEADFPYGLAIIKDIANLFNVETPNIDITLEWFYQFFEKDNHFKLSNFNIKNINDFLNIYKQ